MPEISLFKNSIKTDEFTPPSRTINRINPRVEIAEIKEKEKREPELSPLRQGEYRCYKKRK